MTVVFSTKSKDQNRYTIHDEELGTLFFDRGVLTTSDKAFVRKLMRHPLVRKRGDIKLETNEDVVAMWLEDKEPNKITKEVLQNVNLNGIYELGKVLGANSTNATLIKEEIVGEFITSKVQEILDHYQVKTNIKEKQDGIQEEKEEQESKKTETVKSEEKPKKKRGRPKKSESK